MNTEKNPLKKNYNQYTPEFNPALRKKVLTGILLYLGGFIFLALIGKDINQNPYILRGFLAPALVLAGIIYTTYYLVNDPDEH
ncbi:MAG TPA: hypothetical protein DC049_17340 [Spirochaetia bacterium]|nr:hypothetical protein [Spirochaetia bacterium]